MPQNTIVERDTSGHESPGAFRRHGKKNYTQRMNASRKRRAWLATDN